MTRWEYESVFVSWPLGIKRTDEKMNEMGAQGWELVSTLPITGSGSGIGNAGGLALFKRPLQDHGTPGPE